MIKPMLMNKFFELIANDVNPDYIDGVLMNHKEIRVSLQQVIECWVNLDYEPDIYKDIDEKLAFELAVEYGDEIINFLKTTKIVNFITEFEPMSNPLYSEVMDKVLPYKEDDRNKEQVNTISFSPFHRPLNDEVWSDYLVIPQVKLNSIQSNQVKVDLLNLFDWDDLQEKIVDLHEVNPAIKLLSRHKKRFIETDEFFVFVLPVFLSKKLVDENLRILSEKELRRCWRLEKHLIYKAQEFLGY